MARNRKRTTVDLEGVEDLEAALKGLSENTQGIYLREATAAGAEVVRARASQLAPRSASGSRGHAPGFLSENIEAEVQFTRTQDTAEVHVGVTKDAYYGWFVETGTAFQPARPYLRPALDTTKEEVVDVISDHLAARLLGLGGP